MHPNFKILLLFFFNLLFSFFSPGQNVSTDIYTQFINYSDENGLTNNYINDIVQDNNGFVWIATDYGLNRFDGYTFVSYLYNSDDSLTISGNVVTSISSDNSDNLWIGTTNGLCCLSLKSGEIKRFPAVSGSNKSPRTNHIRKVLFKAKENILWIETLEGTLTQFNITTNTWTHHIHKAISQPYYKYHTLFQDDEGDLWIGGRNIPLLKFDFESKSFQSFKSMGNTKGAKRDDDVADILKTSRGEWYVVATDGIYRLEPEWEYWEKIMATSTFSIAEDSGGYIWFGSGNGVLKYDPVKKSFTLFRNNINNPLSLVDNSVNKVFIDKVGNVWIGTRNGLSCLNSKATLFDYYYHIPDVANGLSANEITSIVEADDGEVYIGTESHGLNIWNINNNSFEQFRFDSKSKCSISSDKISNIYIDSKGMVWVGLWSGVGFNMFNPITRCFTRFAIDSDSRKRDWYNAFLEDKNGNFLLGFWGANGATYFDRENGKFLSKDFITYEKPYYRPVYHIINDGCGTSFFRSNLPLLYMYNSDNNEYFSLQFNKNLNFPSQSLGLESKNFSFPYEFENIYTFTTNSKGLSLFATEKGIIGFTKENGFFSFSKFESYPVALSFWDENRVLLITTNGLVVFSGDGTEINRVKMSFSTKSLISISPQSKVYLFDGEKLMVVDPTKPEEKFVCQVIINSDDLNFSDIETFVADDEKLWVGTKMGLNCISVNKENANRYGVDIKEIITSPISFLLNSEHNKILIFSATGFYSIDKNNFNTKLITIKNIPEGFSTAINSAAWINDSTIWIGTENGHYQVLLNKGELIHTNLPTSKRVSSHLVSTLMEDNKGFIWIGTTDRGLNRVDPTSGFIYHFYGNRSSSSLPGNSVNATLQSSDGRIWVGTEKGLCYIVDDYVFKIPELTDQFSVNSLVEDNTGHIWAGTEKGLLKINIYSGEFNIFDESHGLPTKKFTKAVEKLANGKLAFGTNKGFIVFYPEVLSTISDFGSEVSLTQFNIFSNPLKFQFSQSDTIILNYNQNFFQIYFSSFDFGFKSGTTYLYKLHGVNPDWVSSTTRYTSYTNVQPGKYLFEVTKLMSNGLPAPQKFKLNIFIKPPFWQTVWFRMIILILFGGSIGAYLLVYIRQLKTDRRNVELEQKLLISQMNPHFIFNSLTAIQSFMYNNNPEEAGNYLSSFSRLVRLILENSRSAYIPIKQEIQTLKLYLMLQELRFPDKFKYEIYVDPVIESSDYYLPPLLAQPFIENSIEHGILGMEGNGFIRISIEKEDDFFCITVEDNGIGVEMAIQNNQKKRLTHTSQATSITRDRIRSISSSKDKRIGIIIDDLKSEGKQGTRVQLRFPVKLKV